MTNKLYATKIVRVPESTWRHSIASDTFPLDVTIIYYDDCNTRVHLTSGNLDDIAIINLSHPKSIDITEDNWFDVFQFLSRSQLASIVGSGPVGKTKITFKTILGMTSFNVKSNGKEYCILINDQMCDITGNSYVPYAKGFRTPIDEKIETIKYTADLMILRTMREATSTSKESHKAYVLEFKNPLGVDTITQVHVTGNSAIGLNFTADEFYSPLEGDTFALQVKDYGKFYYYETPDKRFAFTTQKNAHLNAIGAVYDTIEKLTHRQSAEILAGIFTADFRKILFDPDANFSILVLCVRILESLEVNKNYIIGELLASPNYAELQELYEFISDPSEKEKITSD